MSQQINLFHPELRPAQKPLTAVRLGLGLVGLVVALAAYYAYGELRLLQLQSDLAAANSEFKALQDRALKLGGAAAQASGRALEESIARAETELRVRDAVLKRLAGTDLGSTKGFAAYLTALARQRVEGAWITGLTVSGDSGDFTIQGGVTRPEVLLEYIRRLNREEVLKGRQIGDLRMLRKEVEVRERSTAAAPPGQAGAAQGGLPKRVRFVEFAVGTGPSRGQPGG
jgi:hypothetical protein